MSYLILLGFCVICGILGRMGGSGNYQRQMRIIGIPFVCMSYAYFLGVGSFWLLLSFGLMAGALSTYWDFLPINKGIDNFFMHGFFVGLSVFPICFVTGHWWMLGLSVGLLTLWMGIWSKIMTNDILEEFGRYLIVPCAILLVC